VQQGRVNTEALLRPAPDQLVAIEELKVKDLNIPAIEVNGRSGSPEKTGSDEGKGDRN